ncbi:pyruvate dehydrogenase E1 component subunit alpha [Striga asiatica]|uniref:Pyruvate dehydrogenase E1 component subunit alpha n=1 Tax=Striga asiatica TaxID=4170 RepID=A0A5A7PJQ5_STRAF|nr:pyruvate dehydrogenase E1 component subunit alpha [Striga asiatica]
MVDAEEFDALYAAAIEDDRGDEGGGGEEDGREAFRIRTPHSLPSGRSHIRVQIQASPSPYYNYPPKTSSITSSIPLPIGDPAVKLIEYGGSLLMNKHWSMFVVVYGFMVIERTTGHIVIDIQGERQRWIGSTQEKRLNGAEKAHYTIRYPITALKKYITENKLENEADLKATENNIEEIVEDFVEFADKSPVLARNKLLENVFSDPRGFGIGPNGKYRYEDPKFTEGTAQV